MDQQRREALIAAFSAHFGHEPQWVAEAPGRVNLIGEHTDYNDGFVLPVAIDRSALVAAAPAASPFSRIFSLNLGEESRIELPPRPMQEQAWSNYVRGVIWALNEAGIPTVPMEVVLESNVPMGAGLSSSAALEVAIAAAAAALTGAQPSPLELALIAHRAETEFVGVPCGIMDQYISALGLEDHAVLIDCRSRQSEGVPLGFLRHGVALVVVDSGVSRQLAGSAYRERRLQCEEAVRQLRLAIPRGITHLRDITLDELEAAGSRLPETLLRRARHVVAENARVLDGVEALHAGRIDEVGGLLLESHRSLRDDYQVSSPELDLLVDLSSNVPGVLGSRLTGAGFGGCTVHLVRDDSVERFEATVVEEYRRRTGRPAKMFRCRSAGGVARAAL